MLTITNPEVLSLVADLKFGLWTAWNATDSRMLLLIKCRKEMILTAKLRRYFRFYLVPLRIDDMDTYGLITAFFDDHDEPLLIWTPLLDEVPTPGLLRVLSSGSFDVHFFDQSDRELLAYRAENEDAARFRALSDSIQFLAPSVAHGLEALKGMMTWFAHRQASDDKEALDIRLREPLLPDNLYLQDYRPHSTSFHGSKGPMDTTLERRNAGHFGEGDVVLELHRAFTGDEIFLNPARVDTGREFVDVLVVTEKALLLVQAKDSPNTEAALDRNLDRKRATTMSHVKKAADQLRGAIRHLRTADPLRVTTTGEQHSISSSGRDIWGLIVVQELFDPDRGSYGPMVLDIFNRTGVPCLLLDFGELHEFLYFRPDREELFSTFDDVFNVLSEQETLPKWWFTGIRKRRS